MQFKEMAAQARQKKRADHIFTKYVPGAADGKSALDVLDKMSGGKSSKLLLGNPKGVTERDKVITLYH